jgi:hypothetical protein
MIAIIMEKVKSMDRLEILGKNVIEKFAGSTASATTPPNPHSSSQPPGQNPSQPKDAYNTQEFDLGFHLFTNN